MSPNKDLPTQLRPLPVVLSALHLPPGISTLHTLPGIEVSLPKSETGAPTAFKVILSESTDRNLILKSFYDSNVCGRVFDDVEYGLHSLADSGISRCAFTSTFGMYMGEPALNDRTAPQFKVDGLSRVPFVHQGYSFSPIFLVCDHIFCRQEYETQFVAVLSLDFLRQYFIRAQYHRNGWRIQLPPYPPTRISELPIYTDGCCLFNGQAARDPEAKPARGGYGIHFPTLPNGWDMYGALASSDGHTNQKAELTAVIRALQLVRLREIPCANVSIFTDSKYAVDGLNDWIPNLWRSNGYRTTKGRVVVNADLFRSLDEEVSLWTKTGVPVKLSYVPREQNQKADALSKLGATSSVPSFSIVHPEKASSDKEAGGSGEPDKGGKKGTEAKAKGRDRENAKPGILLGKNAFGDWKPLVQWTPDGDYWAEWQATSGPALTPCVARSSDPTQVPSRDKQTLYAVNVPDSPKSPTLGEKTRYERDMRTSFQVPFCSSLRYGFGASSKQYPIPTPFPKGVEYQPRPGSQCHCSPSIHAGHPRCIRPQSPRPRRRKMFAVRDERIASCVCRRLSRRIRREGSFRSNDWRLGAAEANEGEAVPVGYMASSEKVISQVITPSLSKKDSHAGFLPQLKSVLWYQNPILSDDRLRHYVSPLPNDNAPATYIQLRFTSTAPQIPRSDQHDESQPRKPRRPLANRPRFAMQPLYEAVDLDEDHCLVATVQFMGLLGSARSDEPFPTKTYFDDRFPNVEIANHSPRTGGTIEARFLVWGLYLGVKDMIVTDRFKNVQFVLRWEGQIVGIITIRNQAGPRSLLSGGTNSTADMQRRSSSSSSSQLHNLSASESLDGTSFNLSMPNTLSALDTHVTIRTEFLDKLLPKTSIIITLMEGILAVASQLPRARVLDPVHAEPAFPYDATLEVLPVLTMHGEEYLTFGIVALAIRQIPAALLLQKGEWVEVEFRVLVEGTLVARGDLLQG